MTGTFKDALRRGMLKESSREKSSKKRKMISCWPREKTPERQIEVTADRAFRKGGDDHAMKSV
jgi:hypothetical protein